MASAIVIKMNGTKNILALLLLLSLGYTSGSLNDSYIDCGEENSSWMIDCNICKCKDSLADCSVNTCLLNTECGVEGATWKDGCNFCYCFNGQVYCSDNTCLPDTERSTLIELSESNIKQHGGFRPGGAGPENLLTEEDFWNPNPKPWFVTFDFTETYKVNNVTIINTGDSVHDVTSFAIESSNDNQTWTQVKVISNIASGHDQPQFFSMSGEGRYWKLTIQETATEYQPWVTFFGFFGNKSKKSKPECVEGTSWTKECNICNCVDGNAVCSAKTCLPECFEGSYYMVDCNICECYEGKVTCSDLNCLSDPVPNCKDGSRWIEEFTENCNRTCICSNGMTTCTEEICPPDEAEDDVSTATLIDTTVASYDVSTATLIDTTVASYNSRSCGLNVIRYHQRSPRSPAIIKGAGPREFVPPEMLSCMNLVNGELPRCHPQCEGCSREGCQACDDCENISRCHRFNPKICKCTKKFRCRV